MSSWRYTSTSHVVNWVLGYTSPPTPIFENVDLKSGKQLQFKKCLRTEQVPKSHTYERGKPVKACEEIMQHNAENRKSALSYFRSKAKRETSSTQGAKQLRGLMSKGVTLTLLPCYMSLNVAHELLPFLFDVRNVPSSYLCLRNEYTEPSCGFP